MFSISFDALTKNEKIGEGGFGIVYKGTYRFGPAAIKQLQIDNLSPEAEEEFNKEANIMAQLHHPHIVHFYGYCSVPKCLVMEYMPKGSLFKVLHSKEPLDWNIRMRIATEIVSGLAFLHSSNILHRDIKSLNVLLDAQMGAKLTDFGLSKVKNETKSQTTTNKTSKDSVGTVQWMAPELFKRKAVYTQKSDIYSLGITFWELAARKIPYAEDSQGAIPAFVQQGEREDIPADCPEKLSYLIQQCWANDPSVRPSAPEIARFMTTDAKTLQEASSKSPALESTGYQLTSQISPSFTPYQDNLNSNPELPGFKNLEITPPSSNSALPPQRRGSNILNLADKKEEQEKTRYVLEQLRTFFLEDREEGERSENYDTYNEHLKKAAKENAYLVYKPKQKKHILYVNDEPLEADAAAKELSKILKSLRPSNVAAKPTVSPAVQPAAVNSNPIQSQATVPVMSPTPAKAPEQQNSPMLIQFPGIIKPTPRTMNASELKELQDFLKLVAEGEQDKAEAMLKQNPALALTPTDVIDLSKRTFKNITALQYALWALDWHMWTMLLKYIPQKEASEQIAQSEQGLWIPQHGVTANWENLIQALKQYVSEVRSNKPSSVYCQTWVKHVGGAQLLLPAHVINEYCHPSRPFHPTPDFTKPEASGAWRTRTIDEGEWFSAKYGGGTLGEVFAGCRAWWRRAGATKHGVSTGLIPWENAEGDSAAVAALFKTRASQRAAVVAQYLPKQEPARKIANA